MIRIFRYIPAAIAVLFAVIVPLAAIPAPHRVLLVIDTNFQDSVSVGNYYREKRGIPRTNIVYIGVRDVDRFNNYYSSSTFVNFSNDVLGPILDAINNRGLSDTIDYIVLSFGIPVRMQRIGASTTVSTASYIATWLNFSNNYDWSGSPPYTTATNGSFSGTNIYPSGKRFRLTAHLYGYRADEVNRAIDNACAGDGALSAASPYGKWILQIGPYSVLNTNDALPLATQWAANHSLNSMWTNGSYNFRTANMTNTIVLLHGGTYSGYNYANYNTMLPDTMAIPGAYVEAHESFGFLPDHFFESRLQQQFPMPLYFRMGFSTMSGAVTEPYLGFIKSSSDTNCAERFRNMFMRGYTAIESAYFSSWRDERGPTTFVGDPLSRPFARIPSVAFTSPANGASVSGAVTVNVSASVTGVNGIRNIELYIDGSPIPVTNMSGSSLSFSWNSAAAQDGEHVLYAVAYENDALLSPGTASIRVTSQNNARSAAVTSPVNGTMVSDSDISTTVSASGTYDQVRLRLDGIVVATAASAGTITIPKANIVPGSGLTLTAELVQAGAVVCTSAPVSLTYAPMLRMLSIGTTNISTNAFYTNIDFQFQPAVVKITATNVYQGAAVYVNGVRADIIAFDPLSANNDVADIHFRMPVQNAGGVRQIVLSNLNGMTAVTDAMLYHPVATSLELHPRALMTYPGERIKLTYRILDQYSNWMPANYSVVWNTVNGGTATGAYYTAGGTKGDFAANITVGSFTTNISIGIHEGKTNFVDNFDSTNAWREMSTSYKWTPGVNEFIANSSTTESSYYLNKTLPHRTNFTGIVEFEGKLTSATADQSLFGVRVLGECWPDSKYPYRRNFGYGVNVYPNKISYYYQTAASTSGASAAVTKALATNVWYTVRVAYSGRSIYMTVLSNGVRQSETNFFYMNGPVYTNVIRLTGGISSRFRNFKIMDWNASDLAPLSPAAFAVTGVSSNSISVTWADLAGNETGYRIYRSTDNTNFTLVDTTAADATNYTLTSLLPDTSYFVKVAAVNGSGESLPAGPVSQKTRSAAAPAAPSGLSAVIGSGNVTLYWTDNASNETEYVIEQSTDGVTYAPYDTALANATNYMDWPSYGSYWYRVAATNSAGLSAHAGPVSVTLTEVAAPSNFTVAITGSNSAVLNWADAATNEAGYVVYRNWTPYAYLPANASNYADSGLATNTTYYYYVAATNDFDSAQSSWQLVRINPALPLAPSGVAITQTNSTWIRLAWTENASNESGIRVYRSTDNITYAVITNLASNASLHDDTGLSPMTTYYYKVSATNVYGESTVIGPVSVTITGVPNAPGALSAAEVSATAVGLSWTDNASDETGFAVYRSLDGVTYTLRSNLAANVAALQDTGLTPGTTYYYRVAATNAVGASSYAGPVSITPVRRITISSASVSVKALDGCLAMQYVIGKNCTDSASVVMRIAESGTASWTLMAGVIGPLTGLAAGSASNTWAVPAMWDITKSYDVELVASVTGTNSGAVIISNVDFNRFFRLQQTLTNAAAVNNPWRGESGGIVFVNLTAAASVRLYTLAGRFVADLPAPPSDTTGRRVWDVRTSDGRRVAPGVYVCVITSGSEKRQLKVMVLR